MVPVQCKMARLTLALGPRGLARIAQVAPAMVSLFEAGAELKPRTVAALQAAMESAGIEFIPESGGGPGVRLRERGRTIEVREAAMDQA